MSGTTRGRKLAIGCGGAGVVLAVLGTVAFIALDEPRPRAEPTAEAEARVDRVQGALHADAWERTGAVSFTFSVTGTRHLWDRTRHFARTQWDDLEAQVDLDEPTRGVAFRGGTRLEGEEAREVVRTGWERFINDSFWLAAPYKMRDGGTSRALVTLEGEEWILVSYASGGVTPGDAYAWRIGEDGTPTAWRMWVQVLPVGGAEATWEDWVTLPTGARLARRRVAGPVTMEMRDLMAAETLTQLVPGPDPFALLESRAQ